MTYKVIFSPEAEEQLLALYRYIAADASPAIAAKYTESIIRYCESFENFPQRGTRRDDVRQGLRITHYKKRAVVAFELDSASEMVSILGILLWRSESRGIAARRKLNSGRSEKEMVRHIGPPSDKNLT